MTSLPVTYTTSPGRHKRTIGLALLCLLFYLIVRSLLSYVVLSSFSGITLTLEIDQPDRFYIYHKAGEKTNYINNRAFKSGPIPAGKKTSSAFSTRNRLLRNIRLDPGDKTGSVKLYHMKLSSQFGPDINYDASQLFELFRPANAISDYRLEGDHVAFTTSGKDPRLVSTKPLKVENRFIELLFPLILTFIFFLLVSNFRWREYPAILDLSRDLTSTHINYAALDGIRGLAVLLVLLDHSWGAFTGAGTAGVWIFFVLSGFLLTIPFVNQPQRATDASYMRSYLLRRIKRIIPMFYVYVVVFLFLGGNVSSGSIRHLLFLQGDGHLWTIEQEMMFYLILPLIMLANYILFRGRAPWIIASLGVLAISANLWLDKSVISLYSIDATRPPFVGIFITGMLFSYLYHGVIRKREIPLFDSARFRTLVSLTGLAAIPVYTLLGTDTLFSQGFYPPHKTPGWFGFTAGLMIIAALITTDSLYSRLLSWTPLRAMGLVGYSFYLLHPVVISLVKLMQDYYLGYRTHPFWLMLSVLVITYLLSAFTYTYIERPFLKRAQ